jgi:hypothetical protein
MVSDLAVLLEQSFGTAEELDGSHVAVTLGLGRNLAETSFGGRRTISSENLERLWAPQQPLAAIFLQ